MSTYKVRREKMKAPEVALEPHELRAFRCLLGFYSGVPGLLEMMWVSA